MKNVPRWFGVRVLTAGALLLAVWNSRAQTSVLINAFDNDTEVTQNNGQPWQNWYGTAFYQVLWDSSDASNNASSGSLKIEAYFGNSGIGGCCGPQFLVMDGYSGINPPLIGNGGPASAALATNVEFDVRFDPASFAVTNANSTNWPTITVGTRGLDYGADNFGNFTIPASQTNWMHVVIPIGPNAAWTNIPNVFFNYYTTTYSDTDAAYLGLYLDNIRFTTAAVPVVPPTMAIEPAKRALRVFAGSSGQYDRSQVVTVDTNQSWIGGTYPVSYSFTLSDYSLNPPLNQVHVFLIPLDHDAGGAINQYTDYSTASNSVWLQIVGGATNVTCNISWKTNLVNANPDHVALNITNTTAIGTWTLTFSNASGGSLTAPGASPVPFTIDDPDIATDFANPLVAFFGVQPNDTTAIGQHADYARIQTAGVVGVPVNVDFTTATALDTNILSTSAAAKPASVVLVGGDAAYWVNWSYPDYGVVLGTKADLGNAALSWKTPAYFTGYASNAVFQSLMGPGKVWSLIPKSGLPTVDGLSNGVRSANAFFRLSSPGPAE